MAQRDLSLPVTSCMVPVTTVLHPNLTIDEAIRRIKGRRVQEKQLAYNYVVNEDNRLIGLVSARNLLLKEPHISVEKVMDGDVISIRLHQTLGEAMRLLVDNHLLALPVLDDKDELVGAIDANQFLDETDKIKSSRGVQDVFQLFGVVLEEGKSGGAFKRFLRRFPWICCNMFGGLFCAVISRYYEMVLVEVLLLAMFIPLVLSMSESVSMQSMTQSLQYLRGKTIHRKQIFRQTFREWQTVAFLSTASACIVGTLSLLWGEGIRPAIAIGLGLVIGVSVSAAIGGAIPYILHHWKLDPKVAAGPIVLMFADIITTAVYLSIATSLLAK